LIITEISTNSGEFEPVSFEENLTSTFRDSFIVFSHPLLVAIPSRKIWTFVEASNFTHFG